MKGYCWRFDPDAANGTMVEEKLSAGTPASLQTVFRANGARINVSVSLYVANAAATPDTLRVGVRRGSVIFPLVVLNAGCPNCLLTREEFGLLLAEEIIATGDTLTGTYSARSLVRINA